MKKLTILFAVAFLMAITVAPAMAGPSRAIIQEMGSTIGKDEVNVDLDWVSQSINVASSGDTSVGNGNATLGGIVLSSVNVGITDNLELRLGRLPGLRSFLTLPVGSGNNYGLTIKGAIPGVKGLAAYLGYGSSNLEDVANGDSAGDTEGSSFRIGAAYTWAGPVIVNASVGYAADRSSAAGVDGPDTNTTELSAAALYPLKSNVLVGGELHYDMVDADTVKVNLLVPALGARILAGNWTIDAIALLYVGADTDIIGADTATGTVVGVPTLRANYKF